MKFHHSPVSHSRQYTSNLDLWFVCTSNGRVCMGFTRLSFRHCSYSHVIVNLRWSTVRAPSPSLPPSILLSSFPSSVPPSLPLLSHQASRSNPPIEEGDQVLHINGTSVTELTHKEVMSMIRAIGELNSSEMAVIVKPQNLTRDNPSTGSEALPKISDPGQMLRQSLTYLKESLASGNALSLQFDVSKGVEGVAEREGKGRGWREGEQRS